MTVKIYRRRLRTSLSKPALSISWRLNTRKSIVIELHATLPYKRQLVKTNISRRNYTTLYVGLTAKLAKKLKNLAGKQGKTESEVLRKILNGYLQDIEKKGLPYEPYRKYNVLGLKTLPRTIRKDQDAKLREIAEKTGRKISELVREEVEIFK